LLFRSATDAYIDTPEVGRRLARAVACGCHPLDSGPEMQRTILNFWLDVLLLVVFVALVAVSGVIRFVFPPGPAAAGWRLWGGGYQAWSELQFGILSGFILLVLLHVMLHWNWVCGVLSTRILLRRSTTGDGAGLKRKMDEGIQTLYGVVLLMVILHLLGAIFLAARLMIEVPT
jgi:hypothetical protein